MTVEIYGETLECSNCGSENLAEKRRSMALPTVGEGTYPVAVCLECGWERSL